MRFLTEVEYAAGAVVPPPVGAPPLARLSEPKSGTTTMPTQASNTGDALPSANKPAAAAAPSAAPSAAPPAAATAPSPPRARADDVRELIRVQLNGQSASVQTAPKLKDIFMYAARVASPSLVLEVMCNLLLFDRLVADGLWTEARRRELLARVNVPEPLKNPELLFQSLLDYNWQLYRSQSWQCTLNEWPKLSHSLLAGKRSSTPSSALDRIFIHTVNCSTQTECPRLSKDINCFDVLCPYWHPHHERRSDELNFESLASVAMAVAQVVLGVITREQRVRLLNDVLEGTAPKSRSNRVRELALLLQLAQDPVMRPLAFVALQTVGSDGLFDKSSIIDEDMLTTLPNMRKLAIRSLDLSKLEKKLREMCTAKTSYKHFEVSGDKHMGLGEKTKGVLMEAWLKAIGTNKIFPQTLTLYHILWLLKIMTPSDMIALLQKANPSHKWDEDKFDQQIVTATLVYLFNNHALLNLMPPNKFDYEKESGVSQILFQNVLAMFVQTERVNAEGGLRSLLQSLRDTERNTRLGILLSYLLTETHLKAHNAAVNTPVYLSVMAHACLELRDRETLNLVRDGRVEPLETNQASTVRTALNHLAHKIIKLLEWDYSSLQPALVPVDTSHQDSPMHKPPLVSIAAGAGTTQQSDRREANGSTVPPVPSGAQLQRRGSDGSSTIVQGMQSLSVQGKH